MPIAALGRALIAAVTWVPPVLRISVLLALLLCTVMWLRLPALPAVERVLASRYAPVVLGVLSSCAMVFAWTSLRHPPIVQDEAAYVLQAHLFAAGRWADPAPPVPVFFEQPHVLVTPRLAAKYPPGHALLLAPGIWFHQPGLIPVVLLGLTGALVFALARAVIPKDAAPWAAVLGWVGWLGMVGHEGWPRPSYMSEITTSALWVFGWWCLLRWRDERRPRYLVVLALAVGWGAITRPLTMLAYALPAVVVVLFIARRRRAWRQLLPAFAAIAAVFAIIPLWSWRTTGNWHTTPLALYTQQYLPWDVPGLGMKDDLPTRALPAEIACFKDIFGNPRRDYTVGALPHALWTRAEAVGEDDFMGWRLGVAPFAVLGLMVMPFELAFAVASCLTLLVGYLAYAHDSGYTLYYMETQTTIAALAGLGLVAVPAIAGRWWARLAAHREPNVVARSIAAWSALLLFVLAIGPTSEALRGIRRGREIGDLPHQMFRDSVASLPDQRAIVFLHFGPGEGCGQNLIENTPPLATAPVWVVYDRGAENARLMAAAPDRVSYRFDANTFVRQRISPDSGAMKAATAARGTEQSSDAASSRPHRALAAQ